jgi:hypothetical protein
MNTRLTLDNSTVERNRVFVVEPNARYATGGGMFVDNGWSLVVRRSTISANRSELATAMPDSVDISGQSAGIYLGDNTHATIRNSAISNNIVLGTNTRGSGVFCRAGLGIGQGGSFALSDSSVSNNHVSATARAKSSDPAAFLACAGALDLFAQTVNITNTRIVGNSARASTSSGTALVVGGAISAVAGSQATITNSVFSHNSGTALSTSGSAFVYAGAIHNGHTTELRRVTVTDNLATARAPNAAAHGGGIYSGLVPGLDSPVHLTVVHSTIARNKPNQCQGC